MVNRESLQQTGILAWTSALGLGFVAWSGTQIYVMMCAPPGVLGFFQSLITMDSSPCQAIFSLISHGQTLYAGMIGALLLGVVSFLASLFAQTAPANTRMPPKRD